MLQLLAHGGAVVGAAEIVARGDAGDEDALLGHLARAQRLGHRLVRDAEQIGGLVRPEALGLVVGGNAHDGVVLAGQHARRHGHVGGGDVRAHDGQRLPVAHVVGELRVHEVRPDGAAAPQKPSGEREAPGEVVDGTRGAREQRRSVVSVEHDAAVIQHVDHLDVEVVGDGRLAVRPLAVRVAHELERLRDGVGSAAVAGAHRCVHHDDQGLLQLVFGRRERAVVGVRQLDRGGFVFRRERARSVLVGVHVIIIPQTGGVRCERAGRPSHRRIWERLDGDARERVDPAGSPASDVRRLAHAAAGPMKREHVDCGTCWHTKDAGKEKGRKR